MMDNTINGRTPEEIKKGLECCKPVRVDNHWKTCDTKCPYIEDVGGFCRAKLMADTLALIQQLERERDAAIILLRGECRACLHNEDDEPCRTKEVCQCCVYNEDAWGMDLDYNWQWRGVQKVESNA
jgi:hypothetical protein